jgi:sulfoxide reductase heme-binding subunit YedZ
MVLINKIKSQWLRVIVHVGALLPFVSLAQDYVSGAFIIDPIKEITVQTGRTGLILLVLSLACTPIHTIFGFRQALRVRRALGLYAFFYISLHFLTFIGLDYAFDLKLLGPAIFDQRFVIVGFLAFIILTALAITSTRGWQKRLGKSWKRLHKSAYLAGLLAVVHFLWVLKDPREPLRYGLVLAALLVLRIPRVRRVATHVRNRIRREVYPLRSYLSRRAKGLDKSHFSRT